MAMRCPTTPLYALSPVARAMHVGTWRMRFTSERTNIRAQTATFGGLTASRANVAPSVSRNIPAVSGVEHKYILYWCDRRHSIAADACGAQELDAGDLVLLDTRVGFEVTFPVSCKAFSLIVDGAMSEREVKGIAALSGRRLPRFPALDVAIKSVVDVAITHGASGALPRFSAQLSGAFFNLLSIAHLADDNLLESRPARLRHRGDEVRTFIERHYADPDLSVARIARALGISTRYVAKSLACDGEKPLRYLLAFRLERAAQMLRDGMHRDKTITEIAFRCGFNSSSHFSSAFRSSYGICPREYRKYAI